MDSPTHGFVLLAPILAAGLGCADGLPPTEPRGEPVEATAAAASPLAFRQITAGTSHTCGVTTDNLLYCWGFNKYGSVGDGSTSRRLTPVPVAGSRTYRQVSAGVDFTCAVTMSNRAFCWGTNSGDGGGQLGDGSLVNNRLKPVAVLGGHAFRQVTAGLYHACAVATDDRAWCWGSGQGALGYGADTTRREPVPVAGSLRFRQVSAGWNHTCGVTTDDRAYCWGLNSDGQLGDSTQITALRPVSVAGGRRFRQVDGGGFHTCGVTTEGGAFCWGDNFVGQIGDGRTAPRRLWPVRAVAGGLSFRRVEAGGFASCGVTSADVAYCWGYNETGARGDGTTAGGYSPVPVGGGHAFAMVITGGFHSCGRTTASRGYCWGSNFYGSLGDGTRIDRLLPTAIAPPAP
jgi:alpha-tubulin suppressor-like RCC1 family protein